MQLSTLIMSTVIEAQQWPYINVHIHTLVIPRYEIICITISYIYIMLCLMNRTYVVKFHWIFALIILL